MSKESAHAAPEAPWPKASYAWYVVFVLTLAYTCSFIDRQILTLLIEPIRRDLQISDTQISLLGGLAFTIFYTTLGIPLAWLADRTNRRNLMAAGLAFWSLATALCGVARSFGGLFLARVGVGVGEAALSPAAFSLLADYFPPKRLARAASAYSTGVYFGAGLALMIGGTVIQMVSGTPTATVPFVGEIFSWQLAFFVVGSLGLPILLLMLTIREPLRRGVTSGAVDGKRAGTWATLRAFLRLNARTVSCLIAAFTLFGIAVGCYLFWAPSMMMRNHGWSAPRTGFTIGGMMFVLGTLGVYAGGWVADRLATAGRSDAVLRSAFIGMACGLPAVIATPLIVDPLLATGTLAVAIFFLAWPQGLPATALQIISPNLLRAQMTAVYFFIGNLIANGFGPTIPALLSDYVFQDPAKLPLAVAMVGAVAMPLSLVLLRAGLGSYRESARRAGVG
jgi:MFS family permease